MARGAHVLTIAEENVAKETDDLVLTAVHPYLSPISMVVPTQLIAYLGKQHIPMIHTLDFGKMMNFFTKFFCNSSISCRDQLPEVLEKLQSQPGCPRRARQDWSFSCTAWRPFF